MAEIGSRLRVKYGLSKDPTQSQQQSWAAIANRLIEQGYSREEAGRAAARQLFPDFGRNVYASEGDTIEMLLRQIAGK